ncbi:MAG: hypothetical protein LBF41_03785 [Deltaproteobacteria bacterium]|jgi:lipopolysaccharide export system protein LptA|nr:hypothetical protein [Deltaproteobacteria bacterium]
MFKPLSAISLAIVIVLFSGTAAFPRETPAPPGTSGTASSGTANETPRLSGPVSISADHMTADDGRRLVTFTGRVIARQGDLVISCDTMRVTYQPAGAYSPPASPGNGDANGGDGVNAAATDSRKNDSSESLLAGYGNVTGGQEIDKVECEGAVKIQEGGRLAVAEKALYLSRALPRRLVLTGDARVWQGGNSITGHQITYYLDENRSVVDSRGSQRVRAFYERGRNGN